MPAKQATNDKLQGNVATYFRCGGVANNQIRKGLLPSLSMKLFFKSVNIWQSYKQEDDCLVHFLRLLAVCWTDAPVFLAHPVYIIADAAVVLRVDQFRYSFDRCYC